MPTERSIHEYSREFGVGQIKFTGRSNTHKIESQGESWALSLRGPWAKTWQEYKNNKFVTLAHGRQVVAEKS